MCEYCEGKELDSKPITEYEEGFSQEVQIDDGLIYIYCECGRHLVTRINYCPMCGRKL
jgi:uncharacterized OB-fold protein